MAESDGSRPGGTQPCVARCAGCARGQEAATPRAVPCPLLKGAHDDWIRCCTARFLPLARQVAGDDETARDVLQESWIATLRGIHRYRGQPPACAWVRTVVRREAMRQVMRRRRNALADEQNARATPPPAGVSPEDDVHRQRMRLLLLDTIASLPPADRRIIRLRDLEVRPADEVAVCLHVSRSAVSSRLHRAHALLRGRLQCRLGLGPRTAKGSGRRAVHGLPPPDRPIPAARSVSSRKNM